MRVSILICESHIEWNMLGFCTPVMHCNDCWLLHNYILDMHFQFDRTISVLSIDFRMIWAYMGWTWHNFLNFEAPVIEEEIEEPIKFVCAVEVVRYLSLDLHIQKKLSPFSISMSEFHSFLVFWLFMMFSYFVFFAACTFFIPCFVIKKWFSAGPIIQAQRLA